MSAVEQHEAWVDAGPGRIFVKEWRPATCSDAPPIVLFHDSLGCVELWRDFPDRLCAASARRVIAYDRLGFGRSDPHPGQLDSCFVHEEAHGSFRALREALELDAFVAFGHSVGGGMAIACAAAWPDACRALVTESAQAFVEDRTVQGIVAAKESFERPGQIDRLRRYHGDKAGWVLRAWTETWLAPGFAEWSLDDALRAVRCPVLAIHGDGDEFGSEHHPQRIASLAGGISTMHVLRGCGHVPHREQADLVLDTVCAWLATVDA